MVQISPFILQLVTWWTVGIAYTPVPLPFVHIRRRSMSSLVRVILEIALDVPDLSHTFHLLLCPDVEGQRLDLGDMAVRGLSTRKQKGK